MPTLRWWSARIRTPSPPASLRGTGAGSSRWRLTSPAPARSRRSRGSRATSTASNRRSTRRPHSADGTAVVQEHPVERTGPLRPALTPWLTSVSCDQQPRTAGDSPRASWGPALASRAAPRRGVRDYVAGTRLMCDSYSWWSPGGAERDLPAAALLSRPGCPVVQIPRTG